MVVKLEVMVRLLRGSEYVPGNVAGHVLNFWHAEPVVGQKDMLCMGLSSECFLKFGVSYIRICCLFS